LPLVKVKMKKFLSRKKTFRNSVVYIHKVETSLFWGLVFSISCMVNKVHNRKSIRLKGYDYSQEGLYFITLVCQRRAFLFGEIIDAKMILNDAGKMIEHEWLALKKRFPNIELHEFVVMPNHFHGIIEITDTVLTNENNVRAALVAAPKGTAQGITRTTVGNMIGAFKSITTVEYIKGVKKHNWQAFHKRLWHRNYYERIIRNDRAFLMISEYIEKNPRKWWKSKRYY